jgi:hypothetical protein
MWNQLLKKIMYIFEIDFDQNFLDTQKDNKIEVFLADCVLTKFQENQQKKENTWLELLEIKKIKKLGWEYLIFFDECDEEEYLYHRKEFEYHQPSYYGYTDKNGKFVDRFEIARRKRKAKQRIFDRITWGIFFLGVFLTIGFVFFWKMTFVEHVIYFSSLWVSVYTVMIINYFKLKDLPRPFLCNQRTL